MRIIQKNQKMKSKTMEKRIIFIFIFSLVLFCLMKTSVNASTLSELTLKDLCDNSSDIVIAEVISRVSYLKKDEKRIYTTIKIHITEKLKGEITASEEISLKVIGGSVDGITTLVIGAPSFNVGEKSILFLNKIVAKNGDKNYVVTGLSQGKFNIFSDSESKTDKVVRDHFGIPLKPEKDISPLFINDKESIQIQEFLDFVIKYIK
ncbi:MAG: hypothetical protein PHW79_08640 [Candidatus Marinimicrobia bacterium]|nr:hypothetical protein [Candidatus Neomarinimicrobiota bacterium]